MKEHWDKIIDALFDFEDLVTDFGNNSKLSHGDYKKFMGIRSAWEKSRKLINEFNNFISPINSIAIKYPNVDKDFLDVWTFYKEYLLEQHGVLMKSRYELKALELLWKTADSKKEAAIDILNFSMGRNYKGFYKPNENTTNEITNNHDPDFA